MIVNGCLVKVDYNAPLYGSFNVNYSKKRWWQATSASPLTRFVRYPTYNEFGIVVATIGDYAYVMFERGPGWLLSSWLELL